MSFQNRAKIFTHKVSQKCNLFFIFERMNGFLKQSSSYELLFLYHYCCKRKNGRKKMGVRWKKNSFILSRRGKNSSHNCCQNLYKVKKRKDSFFSNILSSFSSSFLFQRAPVGGKGPEFMLELIGGCMPILPPMGGAGLPAEEGGTPPDTPPVMLAGNEGRSSNLS